MAQLNAAGYIVYTDEAIFGTGATPKEALEDAQQWLGRDCDVENDDDIKIKPATAALIEEVAERGGAISWGHIGNVACTNAEEEDR